VQLFAVLGYQPPLYGHIAPIQKLDGASKRKLSKRHDPEATVSYYDEQGYPATAVVEYLLNLANSNFEGWRKEHPENDYREFILTFERLANPSGALFDFTKLNDVSKEVVAHFSAEEVYAYGLAWARRYDAALAICMEQDHAYTKAILAIERGGSGKMRKDIAKWADLKEEVEYFFDDVFKVPAPEVHDMLSDVSPADIAAIIRSFIALYDQGDSSEQWFEKIQDNAHEHGYARNTKEYKADPGAYKGNVSDVAKIFRVALTGKIQTPDLYSIMQVMGKERVFKRLSVLL
jgi:glutamyl-tRNA synthetase